MESLDAAAPPRPVMALQVGVTGHRALPNADLPALQVAAAGLFRAIRDEVLRLHAADQAEAAPLYRPEPPLLRCICGLAEGADAILAEAALAEGWTLVATLPFPQQEFARDFAPGPALERFQGLLRRAAVVFELDGSRHRGGEPYADVGQQIVEQSDLMLAVWDGLPARGPGGTGDVVQRALETGLPLGILPPEGPIAVSWRGANTGDLAAMVRAILLPPADPSDFPQAYYRDTPRGVGWAGAAVRCYEQAILLGAPTRTPIVHASPDAAPAAGVAPGDAAMLPYFTAADRLATEYAARYRAAGLLRYGLIVPATLGAFVGSYGAAWMRPAGLVLQLAALIAVVAFSAWGRWERAQERFTGYRALAEFLRNARLLALFGAVARTPRVAPYQVRSVDWTAWYGHAVIRGIGLMPGRLDVAAVAAAAASLRAEVTGQIAYLVGRAARFTAIARRLRRIGITLFGCGIVLEAAGILLLLDNSGDRLRLSLNELSLVLPALAPVFLGLLSFGEYGRLATRYHAVAAELQAELTVLDRAEPDRAAMLRVARRVAEVMLAEGADWQALIKARSLTAY